MGVLNKGVAVATLCFVTVVIQAAQSPATTPLRKPPPQQDKIKTTRRQMECIEEVRVDPEVVAKVKRGEWQDNNPLLKQWVLCVLMKAGLMTREGVYRLDVAMAKAPKEHKNRIESIIDKCLSQKAEPAPVIAYRFARCYYFRSKGNFTFASIF